MINIRPVSDLRNKYPEIEKMVLKEDEEVYLTKNGYVSMVVLSLEKYSKLLQELNLENKLEMKYKTKNIEQALKESENEINNEKTQYLTSEEVYSKVRRNINAKK